MSKWKGKGYIYVLREIGTYKFKIGYTRDRMGPRTKEVQTGNPERLELVLEFEGDRGLEASFHRMLADYRIRPDGEWFYLDPAKLFAELFRYSHGVEETDPWDHRVPYDLHIEHMLKNHFILHSKDPKPPLECMSFEKAYSKYLYYCDRNGWTPVSKATLRRKLVEIGVGHVIYEGVDFFNMVVNVDSILMIEEGKVGVQIYNKHRSYDEDQSAGDDDGEDGD